MKNKQGKYIRTAEIRKKASQKALQRNMKGKKNPNYGNHKLAGAGHFNWSGETKVTKDGYVLITVPNYKGKLHKGRVLEHRYKIEQKIGRFLTSEEQIHHINGVRNDNRIENLMLFPNRAEHQRYHKEILIVSNNLIKFIETDIRAIIRINLAWENTEEKAVKVLNSIFRPVFLDFPMNRTKHPLPQFDLNKAIEIANLYKDRVKYFAISNAETSKTMKNLRNKLDKKILIVPKIETEKGIKNFKNICISAQTNMCMLDREDLFKQTNFNIDKTIKLIDSLYVKSKTLKIRILELQGMVFSNANK